MTPMRELEPHELLPVAVVRCLAIVEYLGRSRSASLALSLQKVAIFDSGLKNPKIARRLLTELAPDKLSEVDFSPVLYPGEEEHGGPMNKLEVTKIASLLSRAELITLEYLDGTLILRPKGTDPIVDASRIPLRWITTLKAFKALASKSTTTLQGAVFRELKDGGEQYIFVNRETYSEGGNKRL